MIPTSMRRISSKFDMINSRFVNLRFTQVDVSCLTTASVNLGWTHINMIEYASGEEQLREHVRGALQTAGLSQAEASRLLGLSTKHLNMMLKGHSQLTLDWAERLLHLCGKRIVITTRRRPRR